MSRTIRRKDNLNKYDHVEGWVEDNYSFDILTGAKLLYGFRSCGKYHGCTKEQVLAKLNAKWYGEVPRNWSGNKAKKEYCCWKMKSLNRMELIMAIKNGDEENLVLTDRRCLSGEWWWYN